MRLLKGKRILCTGGSGFLGRELVKRLSQFDCDDIIVVSKNEESLLQLKSEFPKVEIVVGDISNKTTCEKVCDNVDGIFHLAAFKHTNLAEDNVKECIQSNINGSMNLLDCTLKNKPEFILGISTDKAAKPSGVYGMTKFLMEKMFKEYEKFNQDTKYRLVRFGNIWNSTGSLADIWIPKIKAGKAISLTDPRATRFFWTVEEAVDLIFECLDKAKDHTPFTPVMKSVSMLTVLEACLEVYGKCPVEITGLKEGEKLHELITDTGLDSSQAEQYTKEEFKTKFLN